MLIGRLGPSLKGSATSRTVPPTSIAPRTAFGAIEPLFAVWRQLGAHALNRAFAGKRRIGKVGREPPFRPENALSSHSMTSWAQVRIALRSGAKAFDGDQP